MQKNINLQDLPQQKLRDLLEFPCDFTFKVMGVHREGLVEKAHIIQFLSTFWQKILSKLKPYMKN